MTDLRPSTTSRAGAELTAALAAPLLDPLWLLGRQAQTTELSAEDGGSVTGVEFTLETALLEGLQDPGGGARQLDVGRRPLEVEVDAEPLPEVSARGLDELAGAGLELLRVLAEHGAVDDAATFRGPIYRMLFGEDEWSTLDPETRRRLAPWRGRVPDPRLVVPDVVHSLGYNGELPGRLPLLPGVSLADAAAVKAALREWLAWLAPAGGAPNPFWLPERLESSFTLTATTTSGTTRLHAPEHLGGVLDWHTFVRSELPETRPRPLPTQHASPAPVRFPGMPLPRFWEIEDGDVNLDLYAASGDAIGLNALLAFLHQYGTDWTTIPVELPTGSVTLVRELWVRTTFGERIRILGVSELDGADSPWQVFTVSADPEAGTPGQNPLVLVHSTAAHPTGPILEDVLLLRDEMANLAWAVERVTQDRGGGIVDRYARHRRLEPAAPARPGYRLGSRIPDYWYALQAAEGARPMLELADLPEAASRVADLGVRGRVLDHRAGAKLHDEEVPSDGASITRRAHVARWADGSTHAWRARAKQAGTGEGSSGLRFDYLDEQAAGPAREARPHIVRNLVRNPDFDRARQPVPPPTSGQGGGPSAAEDWTLWNNDGQATAVTELVPTTRVGATGSMLHVTTTKPGCGLVQQWAPNDMGPSGAIASAWVYVVRGAVFIGAGNGGNTGADARTAGRGAWVQLTARAGRRPVNEVILYADDPQGADFYVDAFSLVADEPPIPVTMPRSTYGLGPLRLLALALGGEPFHLRLRGHAFGAEFPETAMRVFSPADVTSAAPLVVANRRAPQSAGWYAIDETWRVAATASAGLYRIELDGPSGALDAPLTTLPSEAAVLLPGVAYGLTTADAWLAADAGLTMTLAAAVDRRFAYRLEDARGDVIDVGVVAPGERRRIDLSVAAMPWRLRADAGWSAPGMVSFDGAATELLLARDAAALAAIDGARTMYPLTRDGVLVVHAVRPERSPTQVLVRAGAPLSLRLIAPLGDAVDFGAFDATERAIDLPSDAPVGRYDFELRGAGAYAPLTTAPYEAAQLVAGRGYETTALDAWLLPIGATHGTVTLQASQACGYRIAGIAGTLAAGGSGTVELAGDAPWRVVAGGGPFVMTFDLTVLLGRRPAGLAAVRDAL